MFQHVRRLRALAVLLAILTAPPVLAGEREDAMAEAARKGDLDTVRKLVDEGLDVNASLNRYGATAISFACDKGHLEVVRFLLEKGADIHVKDSFYDSEPVSWAVFGGHAEIVGLLVENGAAAYPAANMGLVTGNPDVALAVVRTGKLTAEELAKLLAGAENAKAESVVAALKEAGAKPLAPSVTLPPEVLERFVGAYRNNEPGIDVQIAAGDGVLMVQIGGAPESSSYVPFTPTEFHGAGGALKARFDLDGEAVTGFKLHREGRTDPLVFVRLDEKAAGAEPAAETVAEAAPEAETAPAETPAVPIPEGAAGANWAGFRGPNAAGTAKGTPVVEWNVEEGKNVLWKASIPGRAHASPIVWGERVFIATAVAKGEDEKFPGNVGGEVTSVDIKTPYSWEMFALDRKTGEVAWHQVAAEGMPRAAHHVTATQANATPVTDGKRLVAALGSEGLFAWDLDGKLLWENDLGVVSVGWFYDESYEWGYSASPIIHKDTVIVQVDRHKDPFIAAYALADGKEVWRTPRENLPSFSSPTLLTAGGRTELVTNGSYKIRGYDPDTGKELWNLGPTSELVVGTPVVGHGMAYFTGGYPPVRPIYAVRPGGKGDISTGEATSNDHVAWSTSRGGTYEPTPLLYGDHLYMTSGRGIVTCYDARTGEQVYQERMAKRGGTSFTSSAVAADGRMYWFSDDGDGYVAKLGKTLELLATNPLGETVYASPAIAGDVLFVRSLESVFAIGKDAKPAAPSR